MSARKQEHRPSEAPREEVAPEPVMTDAQKRAFVQSLDKAEQNIRAGRYRVFDAQAIFNELNKKHNPI